MDVLYDVIILGAGPAGLSAGLYAGRSRLKTLLIERSRDGGQIAITSEIENYPGALEGDSGPSLIERMTHQAAKFGVKRVSDTITEVALEGAVKCLVGKKGTYRAKTVITATGAFPRTLGCPRERELAGKGVSYCATCDANFFEDLEVFVVGGGDSALEEAIYLAKFARKVTVIHRRDEFRAAKSIQEKAFANPKLNFIWNSTVEELIGEELLTGIRLRNVLTGAITQIDADEDDGIIGLFVFIGFVPNAALFEGALELEQGYIITDAEMRTSVPGVFAAGDIRVKSLRQVVTAASDGAIAAVQAAKYVEETAQ